MMHVSAVIVALIALILSLSTFLLNFYIFLAIFIFKKIPKKPEMFLIYARFAIDICYALGNSSNLGYFTLRLLFPEAHVKNLSFFIAWPTFNLGSFRVFLVFFMTSDRVFASFFPIYYHKYRSHCPTATILLLMCAYTVFEQYILFVMCDFTIDVPSSCMHLGCTVSKCYFEYWLWFEQHGYFSIGLLSLLVCFRFFVWNFLKKRNNSISRATKIALLDTFILFTFDLLPSFLFSHFPAINFETVGPLSAVCKNAGFVIESVIICKILLGTRSMVAPSSSNKYTPNREPPI
ncbi:Serpentine Receptor, class BC (Class B-like) [Caenorhabditis elegans]|uniref:Serpentine Receptor, class BC (Class B-like) n=1 Tax=Caenorhabditis elegans TaxID=6239 RepID=Q5F4U8_CAEEL|nr:Serpentine Receptor, class BC (Class B-like) [Caenorhabditis elegans]CCD63254.2 Serpentine Receptor, class BC (Class B-like) [Caenorhabditis elegans]|eukprot:NP_001024074.2 Serpentine Receptor, class BC (class B-like) [Caenorhabditis elegans]